MIYYSDVSQGIANTIQAITLSDEVLSLLITLCADNPRELFADYADFTDEIDALMAEASAALAEAIVS